MHRQEMVQPPPSGPEDDDPPAALFPEEPDPQFRVGKILVPGVAQDPSGGEFREIFPVRQRVHVPHQVIGKDPQAPGQKEPRVRRHGDRRLRQMRGGLPEGGALPSGEDAARQYLFHLSNDRYFRRRNQRRRVFRFFSFFPQVKRNPPDIDYRVS